MPGRTATLQHDRKNTLVEARLEEMLREPGWRYAFARFSFMWELLNRRHDFASQEGYDRCRFYLVTKAAVRYPAGSHPYTRADLANVGAQIVDFHIQVDRRYSQ